MRRSSVVLENEDFPLVKHNFFEKTGQLILQEACVYFAS